MIDLLYLSFNRREFTEVSLAALVANTNWDLVNSFTVYDDASTDGTREIVIDALAEIQIHGRVRLCSATPEMRYGNPVAIMNHFMRPECTGTFCKIDSDTMLPPGWLDACCTVMQENPELDLLGIEPPASRKRPLGVHGPPIVDPRELEPGPLRYVPCRSIGGIGMMRRRAFARYPDMRPEQTYGGFTGWQIRHPDLKIGWIAPPLDVFLLDRLPGEPWVSLSREYIAKGWQRGWGGYTEADSRLWEWWQGAACPA